MAAKLIEIKEAAEILGVTPEELGEMRQRGEIHGYRDGGSWKFKTDEVERVKGERGGTMSDPFGGDDLTFKDTDSLTQHDLTLSDLANEPPMEALEDEASSIEESILVSEEALGHSGESTSSTVIGKGKKGESPHDSDIQLASEPHEKGGSGSDVALVADVDGGSGHGSDVKLVAGGSDVLKSGGGSDVLGGSDKVKKGPSDTDKLGGGSDLSLDDDPLEISMGSSLTLGDDDEEKPIHAPGSGVLLGDEDDELVLGGSGAGSDLTLGAGGSGINLKPSDSGLNLEQPLELAGSAVESLELPEDDDMISLEDVSADPEAATQLKADDEFLLTPVEESFADDDSSGSQVIALEDSEAYADENAKTMLAGAQQGLAAAAADPFAAGLDSMIGPSGQVAPAMTAQPMMAPAPAPAVAAAGLPEAPYSIWNVMALMFIVVFLGVTGMLMTDLVRNIWSFEGSYSATTSMMDAIVEAFKLEP
jgi:excisionase family DNA binding protein